MDDYDSDVQITETELIVEHLNLYNCDSCHYETPYPFALEAHQKRQHSAGNQFTCTTEDLSGYFCKQCKYSTVLRINLLRHIREEHRQRKKRPRRLIRGEKWFPSRNYYLGDHIYADLSESQEEPVPAMSKSAQRVYERYTKYCVKVYICFKCDFSTRVLSRMETHFYINHTLYDLSIWMHYHKLNTYGAVAENERKWFTCDKCDYRYYRISEMSKHLMNNHHNKLMCYRCWFRTENPLKMDTHLKFCSKNVPKTTSYIECTMDGCRFRSVCKKSFDRHVQKCHYLAVKQPVKVTPFKPTGQIYSCVECSFQADNINALNVHIRQVHVKKKRVDGKQHLNQRFEHSLIDQKVVQVDSTVGENPGFLEFVNCDFASNKKRPSYSCTECDYKTKKLNILKSHERQKHGLVREYSCNYCEYTSNEKWAVLRHVYVKHTTDD